MTTLTIVFTVSTLFVALYPRVMVSSLDPGWSLTIYNSSSTPYTLAHHEHRGGDLRARRPRSTRAGRTGCSGTGSARRRSWSTDTVAGCGRSPGSSRPGRGRRGAASSQPSPRGSSPACAVVLQAALLSRVARRGVPARRPGSRPRPGARGPRGDRARPRALPLGAGDCSPSASRARCARPCATACCAASSRSARASRWGERTGELTNTLLGGVDALDAYLAQYLPQAGARRAGAGARGAGRARARGPALGAGAAADLPADPALHLADRRAPPASARAGSGRRCRGWLGALPRRAQRACRRCARSAAPRTRRARIERAGERYRELTLGVLRLALLSALVLEALATLGTAVVAVEVGLRLLYARVHFADALFVLLLAPEFYRPLRALGAAFHAGLSGREAAERARRRCSTLPGPFAAPAVLDAAQTRGARPSRRRPGARRARASAARPLRSRSLRSRPRHAARARRLHPRRCRPARPWPSSGRPGPARRRRRTCCCASSSRSAGGSRVDGAPLAAVAPEAWRAPHRRGCRSGRTSSTAPCATTCCSRARTRATRPSRERSALAGLDAVVRQLPRGLDTPVGDGGERLSGGEAQRLALARAFLKDAPRPGARRADGVARPRDRGRGPGGDRTPASRSHACS